MVTFSHEAPLELLRQRPELAVALAHMAGIVLTGSIRASPMSPDFSICVPAPLDRRGDTATLLVDQAGTRLVVVTEVQQRRDDNKVWRWPFYVARARDLNSCQGLLIVICRSRASARRYRRPIPTGHPGWVLTPVVVHRDFTLDPRTAGFEHLRAELTILAAYTRYYDLRDPAVRRQVLNALRPLSREDPDRYEIYTQLLYNTATNHVREKMEIRMERFPTPYWDRKRAEARAEGMAEGRAIGEARGEARMLLLALAQRGITVSDQDRRRVMNCVDRSQLEAWFTKALSANSITEVLAS